MRIAQHRPGGILHLAAVSPGEAAMGAAAAAADAEAPFDELDLLPATPAAATPPSGVAMIRAPQRWLQGGQSVEMSIAGFGSLRNPAPAAQSSPVAAQKDGLTDHPTGGPA